MNKKVVIIDYELGNLFSVLQACQHVGLNAVITNEIKLINGADAIILPGVGAYGVAMEKLIKLNLVNPLLDFASSGRPFLGICLGMQLLFSKSYEYGEHIGLNIIPGEIHSFRNTNNKLLKVPQIQWNLITQFRNKSWEESILSNIPNSTFMYFVHSYYCSPKTKTNILSKTIYGGLEYTSAIQSKNIMGVQFHPEKSSKYGLEIYNNFSKMIN
tara:strand:- start:1508 stop:2149 length:642 start_codon:yes stop_codon:yes gene_type:complete